MFSLKCSFPAHGLLTFTLTILTNFAAKTGKLKRAGTVDVLGVRSM